MPTDWITPGLVLAVGFALVAPLGPNLRPHRPPSGWTPVSPIQWIPDVVIAGLLVYVLNRLGNLSDRVSKIEGLLEGYFMGREKNDRHLEGHP